MDDNELSALQQQIVTLITASMAETGRPPTVREIGHALGITSTGHISYHLKQLIARGVLVQTPYIARGVSVKSVIRPLRPRGIPLQGQIAAGEPLDILPKGDVLVGIDPEHYPSATFALEVRGDSMIEDHILDGDYVLIAPTTQPTQRAIIVATHLTEGEHGAATLKRFVHTSTAILLCPANAAYQPRRISHRVWAREWQVQGVVCGILRIPHPATQ